MDNKDRANLMKTSNRMQALAARALSYYLQEGITEDLTCSVEGFGFKAEIKFSKAAQAVLSECERTILQLLSQQNGTPRTTEEIFQDMDSTGNLHGESTTRFALAKMVKRGLLEIGPGRKGYLLTQSGMEYVLALTRPE